MGQGPINMTSPHHGVAPWGPKNQWQNLSLPLYLHWNGQFQSPRVRTSFVIQWSVLDLSAFAVLLPIKWSQKYLYAVFYSWMHIRVCMTKVMARAAFGCCKLTTRIQTYTPAEWRGCQPIKWEVHPRFSTYMLLAFTTPIWLVGIRAIPR